MKDKTASQLIWEYQRQEDSIESAERAIEEANLNKNEIFAEIIKRPVLLEALETTGMTSGDKLYKAAGKNATTIEITPAPVSDYAFDSSPATPLDEGMSF
jgi:hypothetical protein